MLQIITTWESNNNQGTTLKFPCGVGITALVMMGNMEG